MTDKNGDKNIGTMGDSLGGKLAKHVSDSHKEKCHGTWCSVVVQGCWNLSNQHDLISMGARLQGGKQVVETTNKGSLEAHYLGAFYH